MTPDKVYRFPTRVVNIGEVPLGGNYPVRVQSMTNTDTLDTKATVQQAIRLIGAGSEYVRIAVPYMKEAENLREIKKELRKQGYTTPLIADVHFNAKIAEVAATIAEKVRINPGNYLPLRVTRHASHDHEKDLVLEAISDRLSPLLKICKENGTAIRIGVNHGSLSERIMKQYGDTPAGMVESALEFARICESHSFKNLVFSLKASNIRLMIEANRLFVERMRQSGMDFPLHLGVTEAGDGEDGRIKSAIGIGSLLADGIGDTIRVSLTEDPENEVPAAYSILQSAGVRITRTEYVSCPSCGRTQYNIQEALHKIRESTSHLKGLKIAVMGCVVNGPGEMADAHYGFVGAGSGKIHLYQAQKLVKKNIDESQAVEELIALIKESGDWVEP
ncbi:MAG TPA: (E)-4-hydroxy-3-methylbut-2-enyl-diphosphate synthase [Bacteroidales bacterium]|nr:(E)-4-hydroxy-3-methylbut-2-enyl-diphosphate synthase [Bacteroidales bacterium]HPS61420.1 (E)-4-hydroxy-3-methylbut-2-enyl-diphosphate synthase [Bacteroidales bacterium]